MGVVMILAIIALVLAVASLVPPAEPARHHILAVAIILVSVALIVGIR